MPAAVTGDAITQTYPVIYCDKDGETHWREETADLQSGAFAPPAEPVGTGGVMTASRSLFGYFKPNWGSKDTVPHPTPARQFAMFLEGTAKVTTTDGETRSFGPGAVIRVIDVAPCKGHTTVIGAKGGRVLFVQE